MLRGTQSALGPRVTFNLSPETALVFVADARTTTRNSNSDASLYALELRRPIDAGDRLTISWMLGGGVSKRRDVSRRYTSQGITYPERVTRRNTGAVTLGIGFDQRVAGRLSLRQDFRMIMAGEGSEARAQFGIGLPIGRYPLGQVRQSRVVGTETIRSGHRVWVTDASGSEVSGRVGSIDEDSVEVVTQSGRTTIRLSDIARLERPDAIGDGAKRAETTLPLWQPAHLNVRRHYSPARHGEHLGHGRDLPQEPRVRPIIRVLGGWYSRNQVGIARQTTDLEASVRGGAHAADARWLCNPEGRPERHPQLVIRGKENDQRLRMRSTGCVPSDAGNHRGWLCDGDTTSLTSPSDMSTGVMLISRSPAMADFKYQPGAPSGHWTFSMYRPGRSIGDWN